jgi:hypothetical protein
VGTRRSWQLRADNASAAREKFNSSKLKVKGRGVEFGAFASGQLDEGKRAREKAPEFRVRDFKN